MFNTLNKKLLILITGTFILMLVFISCVSAGGITLDRQQIIQGGFAWIKIDADEFSNYIYFYREGDYVSAAKIGCPEETCTSPVDFMFTFNSQTFPLGNYVVNVYSYTEQMWLEANFEITEAPKCSDGTIYGECSTTDPLYCYNGNLIDKCQTCPCSSIDDICQTDGTCVSSEEFCGDGTCNEEETCSSCETDCGPCSVSGCNPNPNSEGFCDIEYSQFCEDYGCSECYSCLSSCVMKCALEGKNVNYCTSSGSCLCSDLSKCLPLEQQSCSDETAGGECSITKPLFCSNGNLVDKCSNCGCPDGEGCKEDGSCSVSFDSDDADGDGIPDIHDPDADGDGAMDPFYSHIYPNLDGDRDGILDINDSDLDGDGILNGDDLEFNCVASDGGENIYVKGITYGGWHNSKEVVFSSMESCFEPTAFYESYCNNNTVWNKWVECPNQCVDGACLYPTCEDLEYECGSNEITDGLGNVVTTLECGSCEEGLTCVEKSCTGGYVALSASTTKNSYSIGDSIELTEPIGESEQINIFSSPAERIASIETSRDLSFEGYIVELMDEPLVIQEEQLGQEAERNDNYLLARVLGVFGVTTTTANLEGKIAAARNDLENKRENAKEKIKDRLEKTSTLTGSVVSDLESDDLVLDEYENVFNGFLLNINSEEARNIGNISGIKSITPNYIFSPNLEDSVPMVHADEVWKIDADGNNCEDSGKECLTGKGIRVGVIDTGVDYNHQDLGGCFGAGCKVAGGWDFVNNDNDPMDDQGHGTHVASTIAGNGAVKGVAPDAVIYAYKVCSFFGCSESDILAAIERSIDPNEDGNKADHLDIISLSLGKDCVPYSTYCGPDDVLSKAIDKAVRKGVVAVIAAGNSGELGEGTIGSPGTARSAITVGAVDKSDYIAWFSSRGPVVWRGILGFSHSIIKPDIVAPGMSIVAAKFGDEDGYTSKSGTSMATPHVSGAAALVKQAHPDWKPNEIKSFLEDSSLNLGESIITQGYGRLDLKVLAQIKSRIVNRNPNDIKGYLLMKVQKKQDKEWIDVETIVDDASSSNLRTISSGSYLDLKEIFSGSGGYSPSEGGIFRLSVSFLRSDGKVMLDNQKSPIQIYSVFNLGSSLLDEPQCLGTDTSCGFADCTDCTALEPEKVCTFFLDALKEFDYVCKKNSCLAKNLVSRKIACEYGCDSISDEAGEDGSWINPHCRTAEELAAEKAECESRPAEDKICRFGNVWGKKHDLSVIGKFCDKWIFRRRIERCDSGCSETGGAHCMTAEETAACQGTDTSCGYDSATGSCTNCNSISLTGLTCGVNGNAVYGYRSYCAKDNVCQSVFQALINLQWDHDCPGGCANGVCKPCPASGTKCGIGFQPCGDCCSGTYGCAFLRLCCS